jgi:hypothetical protein
MQSEGNIDELKHNRYAPYWAIAMGVFLVTGLSATWLNLGTFWKGYVLDMAGPAWNYILFRGLFTGRKDNRWTRFFTPVRTLVIFVFVCFAIEIAQYFGLYDATFDPWDFIAYLSLLIPVFVMDKILEER